jgi:alpha-amylase/alpha-mannosidase (GH57 family)
VKRYACIHGHFYQPPRENPWTGAVERQPSAGRDHDWNARIARECYVPNGEARVVDGDGRLTDIVDNYAWISFNFGPTLLAWLEKAHPEAYARLLDADKESARRLDGHGNALAQAFHHSILPLASPRDRATEIRWGLADFRSRYGREAEGLWLPECAADDATLAAVAAEGVKFVILEPHQADAVRPLSGGAWKNASDALRPGMAYQWNGGASKLAVFFYDGPLSRSVAFEKAMSDSRAFAARVASRLPPIAEDGLALLATDGESYGHHESFAEMGLAHFLRYSLPEKGVTPVNLGWWLAKHPPRHEVRLRAGGSSWSCEHGVERWRSACGCGGVDGGSLAWRAPLRSALEQLRDKLDALYEKEAAGLIAEPWAARDAYISVALDRSPENVARFLAERAPSAKDEAARVRALSLLELQRHALMMFTSCGWFFDALSRIEPVQVLLYAARALELARSFGADYETEFVAALGDETGVWEKLVKPQIVTPDHVAAHYAVSLLFEDQPPAFVHHHRADSERFTRRVEGGVTVAAGRAAFYDGCTGASWTRAFFSAVLKGQRVQTFVCDGGLPDDRFESLLSAATGGEAGPLPPGRMFLLRDLRPDEREKVLTMVLKRRLSRWEAAGRDQLEDALTLAEQFRGLGLPLPPGLDEETRLSLAHALTDAARRFAEDSFGALDELKSVVARARAAGLAAPSATAEQPFARGVERLLKGLENGSAEASAGELVEAAEAAAAAGLSDWRAEAQVRVFRWLAAKKPSTPAARRLGELLAIKPE